MTVDPFNSNVVYANQGINGLWISEDSAANWAPLNGDGLPYPQVDYIAADPHRPNVLHVVALSMGIYERDLAGIFADGFESGDTSAWSSTSP